MTDWLVITLKTAVISSEDPIKWRGKWITLYYADTHKNLSFETSVTRENRNLNDILHTIPAAHVYPRCHCQFLGLYSSEMFGVLGCYMVTDLQKWRPNVTIRLQIGLDETIIKDKVI